MESNESRRTKMTKRLLKDSLIDLMKNKSIRSITIKEICEKADVNRSTFYRHYSTQYELYDEIFDDITADVLGIVGDDNFNGNKTLKLITDVLTYIEEHRELVLVLLSDKGSLNIGQAFSELISSAIVKNKKGSAETTELEMYVIQFVSAGLTNIIWLWLNTENRRNAKEVANVVNILIMNGLQRAISLAGGMKNI